MARRDHCGSGLSQYHPETGRHGHAPHGVQRQHEAADGSEGLAAVLAWMQYCIEQFGPERCMFESNFPPDKVSFSYNVMYNAFKRLSRAYLPAESAAALLAALLGPDPGGPPDADVGEAW